MIKRVLEKWLCKHKWEVHLRVAHHRHPTDGGGIRCYIDTLICQECGKIKKVKM